MARTMVGVASAYITGRLYRDRRLQGELRYLLYMLELMEDTCSVYQYSRLVY